MREGGTFRVVTTSIEVDSVDPALSYSGVGWAVLDTACAKLMNFRDRSGRAGTRLVPEVAAGGPRVSRDGKTYTFTLRRSFRSVREYREFFPAFLRRHGRDLGLPWRARLLAPVRPLSMAATEIVLHLVKRNFGRALRVLGEVPVVWHPLVAALCLRNLRAELRRTRATRRHVPPRLLYPD